MVELTMNRNGMLVANASNVPGDRVANGFVDADNLGFSLYPFRGTSVTRVDCIQPTN